MPTTRRFPSVPSFDAPLSWLTKSSCESITVYYYCLSGLGLTYSARFLVPQFLLSRADRIRPSPIETTDLSTPPAVRYAILGNDRVK